MQTLACPNCAAPLADPDSAGIAACPYCGTRVRLDPPATASAAPRAHEISPPVCPVCQQADQVDLAARSYFTLSNRRDPLANALTQPTKPTDPRDKGAGGLVKGLFGGQKHRDAVTTYEQALATWQHQMDNYKRLRFCHRDRVIFLPGQPPADPARLIDILNTP